MIIYKNKISKLLINLLLAGTIALTTSCGTIPKNVHEGSHYVAAKIQGRDPEYNLKNPTVVKEKYENKKYSDSQEAIAAGAGLVGQTLTTEIILNTEKIPKDDPYVLGILAFTIGDNLRYGLFPNLRGKEINDVGHLDEAGVKKEYVQGALIAHSVFSIYRIMKNKDFKSKFDFLLNYNKNKDRLEFKVGYNF